MMAYETFEHLRLNLLVIVSNCDQLEFPMQWVI